MNDNIKNMRFLFPALFALLLTACPAGFSPGGGSGAAGGAGGAKIAGAGGDATVPSEAAEAPSDGSVASAPGDNLRPKADPIFIQPMGSGDPAKAWTSFRMLDGANLSHVVGSDVGIAKTLPTDGLLNLRALVQAATGPADAPQWTTDFSGWVRVVVQPAGKPVGDYVFCDALLLLNADGSNLVLNGFGVQPGVVQFYLNFAPTESVDCGTTTSKFTDATYQAFLSAGSTHFLGSYPLSASSANILPE